MNNITVQVDNTFPALVKLARRRMSGVSKELRGPLKTSKMHRYGFVRFTFKLNNPSMTCEVLRELQGGCFTLKFIAE